MKEEFGFLIIVFMLILSLNASAACIRPVLSEDINRSARFCGENFVLNRGLTISKDNVAIDCSSAVIKGNFGKSIGFLIEDRNNVTISNCRLVNYGTGIIVKNSSNIIVREITFLRNMIGVHLIDSSNVSIMNGFDISLSRPVRFSNSSNVTFHYFNKKVKGDFCSNNNCGK